MHLDSNPSVQSSLSRTEQNVNCEHMEQMQIFMFATIRENQTLRIENIYLIQVRAVTIDCLVRVSWAVCGHVRARGIQ